MGKILYADGKEEEITDISLGILQKAVGGYIEVLKLNTYKDQPYSFMIINEEGLYMKLPKNHKASELCNRLGYGYNIDKEKGIVGNVVLLKKEEFK